MLTTYISETANPTLLESLGAYIFETANLALLEFLGATIIWEQNLTFWCEFPIGTYLVISFNLL
jgi:hypothetical protein